MRLFELAELDVPLRDDGLLLEIFRQNSWKRYRVISQSATGRVEVILDGEADGSNDGSSEWLDLAVEEHRWLQPVLPEEPQQAAPRRRIRGKTAPAAPDAADA